MIIGDENEKGAEYAWTTLSSEADWWKRMQRHAKIYVLYIIYTYTYIHIYIHIYIHNTDYARSGEAMEVYGWNGNGERERGKRTREGKGGDRHLEKNDAGQGLKETPGPLCALCVHCVVERGRRRGFRGRHPSARASRASSRASSSACPVDRWSGVEWSGVREQACS